MEKLKDWTTQPTSKVQFKRKGFKKEFEFNAKLGPRDKNEVLEFKVGVVSGGDEEEGEESMKLMSAKTLVNPMFSTSQSNQLYFTPFVIFKRGDEFVGVNGFMGVAVEDWIDEQVDLWNVDKRYLGNRVMTAGPILGRLLRKIATALTKHHREQKPLGFVCEKVYLIGDSFKLCDEDGVGGNIIHGLKNDLKEFQKFVQLVGKKHLEDVQFKLFNELFHPLDNANNIEDILLHSYLICHSPLFWDKEQRFYFATAYHEFRKTYAAFDSCVECDQGIYDLTQWQFRIPPTVNDEIYAAYNNMYQSTKATPARLVAFIRHCYHHQKGVDTFEKLDEKLLILFCDAFPKTYGQLVAKLKGLPLSGSEFVAGLKRYGLDYSKVV